MLRASSAAALSAILFAANALAQQTPPVVVVPDTPAGPKASSSPLDYTLRPAAKPLSARLLQVQYGSGAFGNPFGVQQGFSTFPGSDLPVLVVASPQASALAREANDKFGLATGLLVGALVCDLSGLGTVIAAIATASESGPNQLSTTSAVLSGVSIGLVVAGLGLAIGGGGVMREAINKWLDAVNTYNRQLVDGQLDRTPSQ
jgi:hypothetical protein